MAEAVTVGIVSDTHGWIDPRITDCVQGCDVVLHAGDIMSANVLTSLQQVTGKLIAVKGNNDTHRQWKIEDHAMLDVLPETARLPLPGGSLAMIHGHQIWDERDRNAALRQCFPEARAIVYGHSHLRTYCDEISPWLLNPGAAGKVRNHGGPSCFILHASEQQWVLDFYRFVADFDNLRPRIERWPLEDAVPQLSAVV